MKKLVCILLAACLMTAALAGCGGLGIFLGFLPCSPHCKPEVQEGKELNGDYDFYRPIIRVEAI